MKPAGYFVSILTLGLFLAGGELSAQEGGQVDKVVVMGVGTTRDKAIANASKNAVQQVVGMYVVTDALVENMDLVNDQVLSHSNGHIESFNVLKETQIEDGLVEIQAEVSVKKGNLTKQLGEMKLAVKEVGSAEVVAKVSQQAESEADFETLLEHVINDPYREKKQVYDTEVLSFEPFEGKLEPKMFRFANNEEKKDFARLHPFLLKFRHTLNDDYLNSVKEFLGKSARQRTTVLQRGNGAPIYFHAAKVKSKKVQLSLIDGFVMTEENSSILLENMGNKICKDSDGRNLFFQLLDADGAVLRTSEFKIWQSSVGYVPNSNTQISISDIYVVGPGITRREDWTGVYEYRYLFETNNSLVAPGDMLNGVGCYQLRHDPRNDFMTMLKNSLEFGVVLLLDKDTAIETKKVAISFQ